jgi:CRISPR-associated protein Cst2
MRAKCLEIAYLVRVERANLNASGTEGNVTLLKKVRDVDGNEYVYVSGVAVKYWIKEMFKEMKEKGIEGIECSPVLSAGEKNPITGVAEEQITSVGNPEKYIDDDLFGFLLPQAERKRVAPVKTNGLISLFPYTGDINLGVRYDPKGKEHALWDLEITSTVFRGNWLIELDRIGKFERNEIGNSKELQPEEKEKRIKAFLECFFNLFGGAKQSSFLTLTEPRVVCLVFLDRKTLAVFDRLRVDRSFKLEDDLLLQGFQLHQNEIKEVYIGIDPTCVKTDLGELKEKVSNVLKGKTVKVEKLAEIKNEVLSEKFKFY